MKNLAINTLLLTVSVLLSLMLLEQGFRCWLFGWKAFDASALRNNVPINNAGFMQQSRFDDIYWEMKPNLDTSFKLAPLHTNSQGLADREYPLEKKPGTYRIAILGDSYSMATGVATDSSYHSLLETWMNQHGTKPYEIINFAIGGFGLERYNATLEHKVAEWQPDAILLGFCAFNDQYALPPKTGSVPLFNPPRMDGFWMSYVHAYLAMKQKAVGLQPPVVNEQQFIFIDKELAHMRELADRIRPGMPVLLAYLDNREHPAADIEKIRAIGTRHGFFFVDTTTEFIGKNIDDYSIHLLDSHPNAEANLMFARTIYTAIQQNHWFDFDENDAR